MEDTKPTADTTDITGVTETAGATGTSDESTVPFTPKYSAGYTIAEVQRLLDVNYQYAYHLIVQGTIKRVPKEKRDADVPANIVLVERKEVDERRARKLATAGMKPLATVCRLIGVTTQQAMTALKYTGHEGTKGMNGRYFYTTDGVRAALDEYANRFGDTLDTYGAAKYLGVSQATILMRTRKGQLVPVRVGSRVRYTKEELDRNRSENGLMSSRVARRARHIPRRTPISNLTEVTGETGVDANVIYSAVRLGRLELAVDAEGTGTVSAGAVRALTPADLDEAKAAILTTEQAAERCGRKRGDVYAAMRQGQVPAFGRNGRVLLFHALDIDAWAKGEPVAPDTRVAFYVLDRGSDEAYERKVTELTAQYGEPINVWHDHVAGAFKQRGGLAIAIRMASRNMYDEMCVVDDGEFGRIGADIVTALFESYGIKVHCLSEDAPEAYAANEATHKDEEWKTDLLALVQDYTMVARGRRTKKAQHEVLAELGGAVDDGKVLTGGGGK